MSGCRWAKSRLTAVERLCPGRSLRTAPSYFRARRGGRGLSPAALPQHFLFQILLDAKASEQSARMVAMKNATDNAEKLIKDLTLEYNKLRQGNITKELLDIAGGQAEAG